MNARENILRAVRFERPELIPMRFVINAACWHSYPHAALFELMASHPLLFPHFKTPAGPFQPHYGPNQKAGKPFTDDWGCVWETSMDGIVGTVTSHPLADWSRLDSYVPPDPGKQSGLGPHDWGKTAERYARCRREGLLREGGLRHGHTFLQLCDIRGYTNLMLDMMDNEPRLTRLIRMVEEFNLGVVTRCLQLGAEWMSYPEDLGMQTGPMISPDLFRTYIKPSYERLMAPARARGAVVHMHSDGDIRQLIDDLIGGGVEVVNLQDLVNGVDWIAERFAGKTCIELDIDRQSVTPKGSPADIDRLVRGEVEKLGRREGGLMMVYGLYPGVPLANAKAVMDAMEKYSAFFD